MYVTDKGKAGKDELKSGSVWSVESTTGRLKKGV